MIITVVGLGVVGGSFVKALKGQGHEVYGVDVRSEEVFKKGHLPMITPQSIIGENEEKMKTIEIIDDDISIGDMLAEVLP